MSKPGSSQKQPDPKVYVYAPFSCLIFRIALKIFPMLGSRGVLRWNVLREGKPGGFETRGLPKPFSGKALIMSRALLKMFLVGACFRPRKRKRI